MRKPNLIRDKSFAFAVRVVNMVKYLQSEKKEYVLSKQLLRSGTSIGANVREALNGFSTADFIYKLNLSQKETDESIYWIELLFETDFISEKEYLSIKKDAESILKIIRSIILTSKQNTKRPNP